MKNRVIAKTAIINEKGQVLLLKRSRTDPRRPGEQDFPGGQVDAGEELVAAAAREVREESGLDIGLRDLHLVYAATETYEKDGMSVTRLLFAAKVSDPAVTLSSEHEEYGWHDIPDALELFPHPFYGEGLRYAEERGLLQDPSYDSE